jgi:hypothetical protein
MLPLNVRHLDWRSSIGIEAHPARTFDVKARKRERVRCSLRIDWPVYLRVTGTM